MIPILRAVGNLCLAVGGIGLVYTLVLAGAARVRGTGAGAWGRRRPASASGDTAPRVAVLVPAHDEAAVLGGLLEDLRAQTRPAQVVLVVADRCRDATLRVAEEGGASVLRLEGPEGGKGNALVRGLRWLARRDWDTVLVVDADCRVGPGFLAGCTAGPGEVVQTRVALRAVSGRGGLLYEYLSRVENVVLQGGRAALGLPGFLRGTGMFLGRRALERCPWHADGLTEDRTQGFLFLRAGVPVRHDPDLEVVTPPPERTAESWNQRRRWTSASLPAQGIAATATAAAATRHFGLRAWELPLAVIADARSQWVLLLLVGTGIAAWTGGPAAWGVGLLLVATVGAMATGLAWYGRGFLLVLVQAPAGAALAMAAGALSLVGIRPGVWRKGRPG